MSDKKSYKSTNISFTTADESPQRMVGKNKVNIDFGNSKKGLAIYIVPTLRHDLKHELGIDFWRLYDLLPKILYKAGIEPVGT